MGSTQRELGRKAVDLVLNLNEKITEGLGLADIESIHQLAKEICGEIGRNCRVMCWTHVKVRDPYSTQHKLVMTYWWYVYDGRIDLTRDEASEALRDAQRGSYCSVVDRARPLGPRGRHRRLFRIDRHALASFIESQKSVSEAARKIRQGIYDPTEELGPEEQDDEE